MTVKVERRKRKSDLKKRYNRRNMDVIIQDLVKYAPLKKPLYRGCDKSCDLKSIDRTLSASDEMTLRSAAKIAKRLGDSSLQASIMTLIQK